jgi:DNA anti-recombination protein RmuC
MDRVVWTDERMDDFAAHTYRRFDEIDRRFDTVDKRFEAIERRMEAGFSEINLRFDSLQRTMLQIGGGVIATLIAGIFGIIATQL